MGWLLLPSASSLSSSLSLTSAPSSVGSCDCPLFSSDSFSLLVFGSVAVASVVWSVATSFDCSFDSATSAVVVALEGVSLLSASDVPFSVLGSSVEEERNV